MKILTLLIAGLLIWYWWVSQRAKERAREAGRTACKQNQLMFLDESVVLKQTRLKRNRHGHINFYRCYAFEFTSDGAQRYRGKICLLGAHVEQLDMEPHRLPENEDSHH